MRFILSIIVVGAFYLFINLILWVPQKLYHWKDLNRINEIEIVLSELEISAEDCKNKLLKSQEIVDKKNSELDSLENMLDFYVESENYTFYELNLDKYKLLLDDYNSLVVEFNSDREDCMPTFEHYDTLVIEVNDLIEKTEMWMLIPLPRGSSKRITKSL